jgi:hypothetical protein
MFIGVVQEHAASMFKLEISWRLGCRVLSNIGNQPTFLYTFITQNATKLWFNCYEKLKYH